MNFKESILIALDSIRTNKLRSFLTLLGIVIGVSTVITMMTVVEGINSYIGQQLSEVGANTFFIRKFPAVMGPHTERQYRHRKDISSDLADAIKERATLVSDVSPFMFQWGQIVKFKNEKTNSNISVYGIAEDYQTLNNHFVKAGRFINEMDIFSNSKVCVLGMDVVEQIAPFEDILDQYVWVGPDKFRVIGILEEKGSSFGQSEDNVAVLPYTSFERLFSNRRFTQINVKAHSPELLDAAIDEVIGILRVERKVPPGEPNDFEIMTQDSLMDMFRNITGVVFFAMIGIAGISLLVGGIGIMNIMLVSVTERTREIGIRKAIGAKKRAILSQFIMEAIAITAAGGIIGILVGIAFGFIVGLVFPIPVAVPIWAVMLGVFFTAGVGLFFGIYPAAKAARLDPIEALRYE